MVDDGDVRTVVEVMAGELSRQLFAQISDLVQAQAQVRVDACLAAALAGQRSRVVSDGAAVFRQRGEFWTLSYDGEMTILRDCRGFRHLARLLKQPNRAVHVLEMVQDVSGGPVADHCGLPVLDDRAKREYRRRLQQLKADADDAATTGDAERFSRATLERDFLVSELSRALGLGGRDRSVGGTVERARVAVTKAIRTAMGVVDEHHGALGEHLRRTVHTGTLCSYTADPAPAWVC